MITPPPFQEHQPAGRTPSGMSATQRQLLRHVSRSFDLSIRLLPKALQAPVAIGYLLARATDTVADTTALPLNERQVLLDLMTQAIHLDGSRVELCRPAIHAVRNPLDTRTVIGCRERK